MRETRQRGYSEKAGGNAVGKTGIKIFCLADFTFCIIGMDIDSKEES